MCVDPVTMMAIGAVVTGATSIYSGQVQADAIRNGAAINASSQQLQAQQQRQAADSERIAGQYEARRAQEKNQRLMAQQLNIAASSGVLIDDGSPLDVMIDSRREGDMDRAAIEYAADSKAMNRRKQADVNDYNAKAAIVAGEIQADAAETKGYLGAVSAAVGFGTSDPFLKFLGKK